MLRRPKHIRSQHNFALQAHKVCPSDPLACNELGVLSYRHMQYSASEQWLLRALGLVPGRLHAGKPVPCVLALLTGLACLLPNTKTVSASQARQMQTSQATDLDIVDLSDPNIVVSGMPPSRTLFLTKLDHMMC